MKKYPSLLNKHSFLKYLYKYHNEKQINEILNLKCIVTEKIDGENFRIGYNSEKEKYYIGQKNNTFYNFNDHPHYKKLTQKALNSISIIKSIMEIAPINSNPCFYGELYGNTMQRRFKFDFDGLDVAYFNYSDDIDGLMASHRITTNLNFVKYNITTPPVIAYNILLKDALELDIENIKSKISKEDFIEGVVIQPMTSRFEDLKRIWNLESQLIIKYKTNRFSEQKGVNKPKKDIYFSEYIQFVTKERIHHVIEQLKQEGKKIEYEMKDLAFIGNYIVEDIEKEENEGNKLEKQDTKSIKKRVPIIYKEYLEDYYSENHPDFPG